MRSFTFIAAAFLITACGYQDNLDLRGGWGVGTSGGQLSTFSGDGLGCDAEADRRVVDSAEAFSVRVSIYNAEGAVKVVGRTQPQVTDEIVFTTSFSNTRGMDVLWNPTLTIRDEVSSAKCKFEIYVRSTSLRRL